MRRFLTVLGAAGLVCVLAPPAAADATSKQKTLLKFEGALGKVMNLFGGKAAKEGIVSTISVKGNRQLTVTGDNGELIDLDAEKVYAIDFKDRNYKVKTFAEMRKEFEKARQSARDSAAAQGGKPDESGAANVEIAVDVKKTGAQKTLLGESCGQAVMTLTLTQKGKTLQQGGGMVLTADLWLGPENPGAKEQADFARRYAEKLFGTDAEVLARDMLSAMAMYPGLQDGMARMQKELSKIQGTPYLSTVTFETVMTAEQAQAKAEQDKNAPGLGAIAGGLGGMFGRKKKEEAQAPAAGGAPGRSVFMTSTTELLAIGTTVAAADVDVPAGFKQK
jgi:hypothetical protein